jgi:RNA polymerase sigma-70 factor (ECF subfamily)
MPVQTPGRDETGRFDALIEPHRRELLTHCYRMLGSLQDAEDALQDTLLAAWSGLDGFEGRASLRTWLYRIATNTCLNARRTRDRRPAPWNVPGVELPEPTRLGEITWLQPIPDAIVETTEALSLAFVTALQHLPPRQLAVLVLRDVLDFRAAEVAEMLDVSTDSVNSALKRARAALRGVERSAAACSAGERALVARFVAAYEAADLDAMIALLTDDVFISMPPMPFEYVGREAAARIFGVLFGGGRVHSLTPARMNGQPAFEMSLGGRRTGLMVLTLADGRISAMARFAPLPRAAEPPR